MCETYAEVAMEMIREDFKMQRSTYQRCTNWEIHTLR